ncbi:hypothetical protein [Paenibacillus sp. ATY16]|uniref:hypothetical protein n=1 Tax=Paenibacillus sp. ATY16 TaxID=1759312 RepID=UPI00200EB891|nr:hypothetical protein [Paenibacillus sp. ATY16]
MQPALGQVFMRKIISAGITAFLFTIIFAVWEPDLFHIHNNLSLGARLHEAFGVLFVYMMYAGPVIYVYGAMTSLLSEIIARFVAPRRWVQLTVSAVFHCVFGLIFYQVSLLAAAIFYLSDTILSVVRKKPLTANLTVASVLLPLGLWLASWIYIRITG